MNDKIKLPRIPRKKPTTTTEKTSRTTREEDLITEPEIRYIDPNCHQNLAHQSCERIDSPLIRYIYDDMIEESFLNKSRVTLDHLKTCQSILKYKECIDLNFYIKCQKTFAGVFEKLDLLSKRCIDNPKFKNNRLLNTSDKLQPGFKGTFFIIFLFYIT